MSSSLKREALFDINQATNFMMSLLLCVSCSAKHDMKQLPAAHMYSMRDTLCTLSACLANLSVYYYFVRQGALPSFFCLVCVVALCIVAVVFVVS